MADFNQAYTITMQHEGGYCNDPQDHGGETWRGIARNFWGKWPGWHIVDQIKLTHPANLNKALSDDKDLNPLVLSFYKTNFWDAISLDALKCQQTANQLFDMAVNMGIGTAENILQNAINDLHPNLITVDGKVGPKTISAANQLQTKALYNMICQLRRNHYERILARDPTQAKFRNAWLSRIQPFDDNLEHTA